MDFSYKGYIYIYIFILFCSFSCFNCFFIIYLFLISAGSFWEFWSPAVSLRSVLQYLWASGGYGRSGLMGTVLYSGGSRLLCLGWVASLRLGFKGRFSLAFSSFSMVPLQPSSGGSSRLLPSKVTWTAISNCEIHRGVKRVRYIRWTVVGTRDVVA